MLKSRYDGESIAISKRLSMLAPLPSFFLCNKVGFSDRESVVSGVSGWALASF